MNRETLIASLGALRGSGSVFGLVFAEGGEVVFGDTGPGNCAPADLAAALEDIARHFESKGRSPDQLAFGYDGGNLLVLLGGELRLAVLHHAPAEVDAIAKAARSILKDRFMALEAEAAEGWSSLGGLPEGGGGRPAVARTERIPETARRASVLPPQRKPPTA